jgi:BirA family transcriptional regulator, biotin operon repressor / biotin---[acetyl-CoA-carboxylase] ligase
MQLHPAAAAAGYRLATHEKLASTNAEALACAQQCHDAITPLWITAREQTAGRGRRGNTWISPVGNLYATLLMFDPAAPKDAPQLSFVAGLAVHDAIRDRAPALSEQITLKWPNDILCGGKKIAGILIEGSSLAPGLLAPGLAVAIGIGVNCKHHPPHASYPATDLAAAGSEVSADDLFLALSGAMMERLAQWRRGAGFSATRSDWLDRAIGIGGDMRVRLPDRELIGRCEALDEAGRLLLRLADGSLETITAGDVFPLGGEAARSPLEENMLGHGTE